MKLLVTKGSVSVCRCVQVCVCVPVYVCAAPPLVARPGPRSPSALPPAPDQPPSPPPPPPPGGRRLSVRVRRSASLPLSAAARRASHAGRRGGSPSSLPRFSAAGSARPRSFRAPVALLRHRRRRRPLVTTAMKLKDVSSLKEKL